MFTKHCSEIKIYSEDMLTQIYTIYTLLHQNHSSFVFILFLVTDPKAFFLKSKNGRKDQFKGSDHFTDTEKPATLMVMVD